MSRGDYAVVAVSCSCSAQKCGSLSCHSQLAIVTCSLNAIIFRTRHLVYSPVDYTDLHVDPELMKEVVVRQFMTFHDRPPWPLPMANSKIDNAVEAWMVQAKGSYWAGLRAAAQPLFHSDRRGDHDA